MAGLFSHTALVAMCFEPGPNSSTWATKRAAVFSMHSSFLQPPPVKDSRSWMRRAPPPRQHAGEIEGCCVKGTCGRGPGGHNFGEVYFEVSWCGTLIMLGNADRFP